MIKLRTPTNTVTAKYKIVTPMFIGDHRQEAVTITPASFKGALRFWWRALMWKDFRSGAESDEKALTELHRAEAEIFGSSAKKYTCRSSIAIRIHTEKQLSRLDKGAVHPEFKQLSASRYLGLGGSLMTAFHSKATGLKAATLLRSCINPNQSFSVMVSSRQTIDSSVIRALKLIGLLGGLGSRTRRGIGSISIQSISQDGEITDLTTAGLPDYSELLSNTINTSAKTQCQDIPPYSAFSAHTRVDYLSSNERWINALDQIGGAMVLFRGWGKDDHLITTNNQRVESEKRFVDDHNWFRGGPLRGGFHHPDRIVFGLPLGFDKHTAIESAPLNKDDYKQSRRASPLLFHVHKFAQEYAVISTVLKADFLPNTSGLKSTNDRKTLRKEPVNPAPDWSLITDFLEGDTKSAKARFPNRQAIL